MALAVPLATHPRIRPWILKTRRLWRQHRLEKRLRSALRSPAATPTIEELASLWGLWGETLTAPRAAYLRTCLIEAERAQGPILQCGADLLSVLMGIVCHRSDNPAKHLWILEHDSHWGGVIRSWLERYEITRAHVISAPAEQFGGYVSYVLDASRLPKNFALVACAGSSALPASARGVVQRLADHLDHRCVILGANARRPKDLKFLMEWSKTQGAPFLVHGNQYPFLKIAMRDQRSDDDLEQDRLNTAYSSR